MATPKKVVMESLQRTLQRENEKKYDLQLESQVLQVKSLLVEIFMRRSGLQQLWKNLLLLKARLLLRHHYCTDF